MPAVKRTIAILCGLVAVAGALGSSPAEAQESGGSFLSIDTNSFGGTPTTFVYDVTGSDGSAGTIEVTTSPTGNTNPPTTRGVTGGFALTPGVTYTIRQRDAGPQYRWFVGAGFCFIDSPEGFPVRTVREDGATLTVSVEEGQQVRCFVANLERGRIHVDQVTQPSIGKPFAVEVAVQNSAGGFDVVDTIRVSDAQNGTSEFLDSRVAYFVRQPATNHFTTDALSCGGAAVSGEAWLRVFVADGASINCTVTTSRSG